MEELSSGAGRQSFRALSKIAAQNSVHSFGAKQNGVDPIPPIVFLVGVGATAYIGFNLYKKYREELLKRGKGPRLPLSIFGRSSEPVVELYRGIPQKGVLKAVLNKPASGYYIPAISSFQLKLETFLRVAKIPFEVNYISKSSDKVSHWITVGDEGVTEGSECIPFLCRTYGVILGRRASQGRLSTSRFVGSMLENPVSPCLSLSINMWRWAADKGANLLKLQPPVEFSEEMVDLMGENVWKTAAYFGLGKQTPEQIIQASLLGLKDLSLALGRYNYFLGRTPGEVDCTAFSLLVQMLWTLPGSPFEAEIKKYPNLISFVHRMKVEYFPDLERVLQLREYPVENVKSSSSDLGTILGIESWTFPMLEAEESKSEIAIPLPPAPIHIEEPLVMKQQEEVEEPLTIEEAAEDEVAESKESEESIDESSFEVKPEVKEEEKPEEDSFDDNANNEETPSAEESSVVVAPPEESAPLKESLPVIEPKPEETKFVEEITEKLLAESMPREPDRIYLPPQSPSHLQQQQQYFPQFNPPQSNYQQYNAPLPPQQQYTDGQGHLLPPPPPPNYSDPRMPMDYNYYCWQQQQQARLAPPHPQQQYYQPPPPQPQYSPEFNRPQPQQPSEFIRTPHRTQPPTPGMTTPHVQRSTTQLPQGSRIPSRVPSRVSQLPLPARRVSESFKDRARSTPSKHFQPHRYNNTQ